MIDIHSLNPANVSEGGVNLSSPYGRTLFASAGTLSKPTILPHANLLFPDRVGLEIPVSTFRPALPYVTESWQGPLSLGPPGDNVAIKG